MKTLFAGLLTCALISGCHTVPPEVTGGKGDAPPPPGSKIAWQFWNLRISCNAPWGTKCEGEAKPENEAVIPNGFVHCRTDAVKNSGPNRDAGSWWWLDGNRVRVYARACGGPFYDQYRSWIDVNWITYIVRQGQQTLPENNCRPDTKGAADYETIC